MGDGDKLYPLKGYIDVGIHKIHVKFFSEEDEKQAREAGKTINRLIHEKLEGYEDSSDECAAMLLLELMIENIELKAKLKYSAGNETLNNLKDLLKSLEDIDNNDVIDDLDDVFRDEG